MTEDPPKTLFHYTSPAGAMGILAGTAWATMVHYMNDASEFQYPLSLARELILEELGDNTGTAQQLRLCNDYLDVLRHLSVFAFCLSADGDLLSQWREYCPPAGGYAIAFDSAALADVCGRQGFRMVQCTYERTEQLALLKPVIREIINTAGQLPAGSSGIDMYRAAPAHVSEVAASIKHPSFAAEREWRIVGPRGDELKYRSTAGLVVPYRDVRVMEPDLHTIAFLRVGPHQHQELAGRSIRLLSMTTMGWPLNVDYAKAPPRVV